MSLVPRSGVRLRGFWGRSGKLVRRREGGKEERRVLGYSLSLRSTHAQAILSSTAIQTLCRFSSTFKVW